MYFTLDRQKENRYDTFHIYANLAQLARARDL